ncbi:alpha-2,8-sialyltransferase 8F-like isoform X1 [Leucoraja erinacea]|uniref:alpha-2,8-sialyltransferase 8F-like isoform X1 n=1 Tax=Leucoraja erinaceus TaxID=7782 RepID=UPI002456312D|nr:alpha-2,8-sialyltransferase 8F-like isoform X1 [Leucoraja erinacea]
MKKEPAKISASATSMAPMCSFRKVLVISTVFVFLLGIMHFDSLDYRYVTQLSKLKLQNVFSSTLQGNESERKRQNESERGDRECETCTSSQLLNLFPQEWNASDCESIYKWITSSRIQRQTEGDVIKKVTHVMNCPWQQHKAAAKAFRWELRRCCDAAHNCLVTQSNIPAGTEVTYEGEPKRKIRITHQISALFPKETPLRRQKYKQCAVIGNSAILTNSSCGSNIDSAEYVFRCNLPPMGEAYAQDIGTKTNLVTANPSIITERYGNLQDRRRPFYTNLSVYNEALLLLPAFSYTKNTVLSFRALYTLQDFQAKQEVVFFNPSYLKHLSDFWNGKGVQANRLSTGLMVTSIAIELCEEVRAYGFWPFGVNVHGQVISHHYFDNQQPKPDIHSMPLEYQHLLQMHSKGIIKLQMAQCQTDP